MSVTLKIENYSSLNTKELTALDADAAIAATGLTLTNTDNIDTGDYALIGNSGSENAELTTITSITNATSVVVPALTLQHYRFDPIRILLGNKIKIYRATNVNGNQPTDDAFTTLATIDLDVDQAETEYTDSTGSSDYWYKFTYYNSATSNESALSDSGAARGGGIGNYVSLDAIRQEAGLENNRNVTDTLINQFRQQAQSNVDGQLSGMFTLPFTQPINPTIERITMLYAAGYLEVNQFGQTYNLDAQGKQNAKITEADNDIAKIKTGQLVLIGENGQTETATTTTHFGMRGYPNATTAAAGGGDFKFRASDNVGYMERQY